MMSSPAILANLNDLILRPYQHMLYKNLEGITFLFSVLFSNSVATTAHSLAMQNHLPEGNVIEEIRRLLAIKVFIADKDGTKIMPTNLSEYKRVCLRGQHSLPDTG